MGANKVRVHEERFEAEVSPKHPKPLAATCQVGSQLDDLNHVGAAEFIYNGVR